MNCKKERMRPLLDQEKNRQLDKILTYNDVLNISMLTNSLFTISSMDV
jgi:hypothetical protein